MVQASFIFSKLDADGDGEISAAELVHTLRHTLCDGGQLAKELLDQLDTTQPITYKSFAQTFAKVDMSQESISKVVRHLSDAEDQEFKKVISAIRLVRW